MPGGRPATTLTDNQEAFCILVATGYHRCDAFVKAGYSAKGAEPNSHKLLQKKAIKTRIEAIKKDIEDGNPPALPEGALEIETAYQRVFDPNAEPNYANLDVAWLRHQLHQNALSAQSDGDYKAANQALELILQTMPFNVPKAKIGRPTNVKGEALPTEANSNDQSQATINVSIFNKIAQSMDQPAGNGDQGKTIDITPAESAPQYALSDDRSLQSAFSIDEFAGEVRVGVLGETEGSSIE